MSDEKSNGTFASKCLRNCSALQQNGLNVGKALGYVSHPSNAELFAGDCWVAMPLFRAPSYRLVPALQEY